MADTPTSRARSPRSAAKATGSGTRRGATKAQATAGLDPQWLAEVQGLSFQEARTALELAMAQLQSDALEVEEMADLYRRAEAYAQRCERVLQQVEQEVIQWDNQSAAPTP